MNAAEQRRPAPRRRPAARRPSARPRRRRAGGRGPAADRCGRRRSARRSTAASARRPGRPHDVRLPRPAPARGPARPRRAAAPRAGATPPSGGRGRRRVRSASRAARSTYRAAAVDDCPRDAGAGRPWPRPAVRPRRACSASAPTSPGGRTLGRHLLPAPRPQWWFTGAGAGLDHSSTLLLANLDPGPAVLDLRVLGPGRRGARPSPPAASPVAPHSRRRVDLADIAPQTDDLAVEVHTSRGRVVAAVDDSCARRPTARPGQEWLRRHRPAEPHAPARRAARRRPTAGTLLVANPSDLEAVVDVARRPGRRAPSPRPAWTPITVAPGAIETRRPRPACCRRKEPVALRLRSRVPVVASVRVTAGDDHAYATPVAPLVGPAAAPVVPGARATVQLTAGARPRRVARHGVRREGAGGSTAPRCRRRRRRRPPSWSPKKGAAYVVVTPSTRRRPGRCTARSRYAGRGARHGAADAAAAASVRASRRSGPGCADAAQSSSRVVARVDLLGRAPEQLGDLLDEHGEHHRRQVAAGLGAQLDRPAEQHQPGRRRRRCRAPARPAARCRRPSRRAPSVSPRRRTPPARARRAQRLSSSSTTAARSRRTPPWGCGRRARRAGRAGPAAAPGRASRGRAGPARAAGPRRPVGGAGVAHAREPSRGGRCQPVPSAP